MNHPRRPSPTSSGAQAPVGHRPAGRPGSGPLLATRALSWRVGSVPIVDGVDIEVAAGEFVGVIGPNGAGKTSLFNLISGLRRPTGGQVLLAGRDLTTLPPYQRARWGLGRSFQSSAVFDSLSVVDNVRLAVHASRRVSRTRWRAADRTFEVVVADVLDRVGLSHRAGDAAALLSHGDKRKLEIALLLAGEPTVVLLDEPMAGVPAADVADLVEVIAALTRDDSSRAVLMVEHHIDVILSLADRIAVMHHGALLACDTPAAIMDNRFVQEAYLGEAL